MKTNHNFNKSIIRRIMMQGFLMLTFGLLVQGQSNLSLTVTDPNSGSSTWTISYSNSPVHDHSGTYELVKANIENKEIKIRNNANGESFTLRIRNSAQLTSIMIRLNYANLNSNLLKVNLSGTEKKCITEVNERWPSADQMQTSYHPSEFVLLNNRDDSRIYLGCGKLEDLANISLDNLPDETVITTVIDDNPIYLKPKKGNRRRN